MSVDIRVEIRDPSGYTTDITDWCDIGGLGSINTGIEDDLLQFRTGDVTLTLHNGDGRASALFEGIDPSQVWGVKIYRDGDVYFGGSVQIPASLKYNENEASVEISAFGLMSYLNKVSAEGVRRTFPTVTASIAVGTKVLTFSAPVPALQHGDQVRLYTTSTEETVVVNRMTSSTVASTMSNATATMSNAAVEFITPYYRCIKIGDAVGALFDAAAISSRVVDSVGENVTNLVASPLNTNGLPFSYVVCGVDEGGHFCVQTESRHRYIATSATDGFTADGNEPVGEALGDWRPYLLAKPSSIMTAPGIIVVGKACFDHTGGVCYYLEVDTAAKNLNLMKHPAETILVTLHHYTTPTITYDNLWCEYDPTNNKIWVSWGDLPGTDNVQIVDAVTGAVTSTAFLSNLGMRRIRGATEMCADGLMVLYDYAASPRPGYPQNTVLSLVNPTTHAVLKTIDVPSTVFMWGLKRLRDSHIAIYTLLGKEVRMLVWDSDWGLVSDYGISTDVAGLGLYRQVFVFSDPVLGDVGLIFTGSTTVGEWYVVDNHYSGVVAYANFAGMTVASALAALATLINCVVQVDADGSGFFLSRTATSLPGVPKVLDDLVLTSENDQVWEQYKTLFTVSGGGFSVTLGLQDDNVKANPISNVLIPNESVAFGMAAAMQRFYSTPRREARITVDDDGTRYTPMQRVEYKTVYWWVYEIDHSLGDREVGLRLVEIA